MVSSNHQGLVEVSALAVKLLISVLGVEHFVHDVERHIVAHMFETVLVNVVGAFINTRPSLTLVTGGQNWLELSETFEQVFLACFLRNHF